MTEPVALESILPCFRGVIPSPFATCAPDGTPNITYMSIVHYVDAERVALSRQFFNKTAANLDANPQSQLRVVDPETLEQYELDLAYLHTETEGPRFEAMRTALEAIASESGMGGVFRLRGVDVHRVVSCARLGDAAAVPRERPERDVLVQLDELTRRLGECSGRADATWTALEGLEDLFGFRHAVLFAHEVSSGALVAVAGNGAAAPAAGARLALGDGVIGTAAARRRVVCVSHLERARVLQEAARPATAARAESRTASPFPVLARVRSVAAVPLVAGGELTGALYLESEQAGAFGPHNERLLRIVGNHLALALRDAERPAAAAPAVAEGALRVTYYQADDSVFVGDRYVVKGTPGRILWKLLREHGCKGRSTFTNRELRLDERLGLPAGADNLESRLLALRRRLAGAGIGIELERVGRGQLELRLSGPLHLHEVETRGPLRAAHDR